MMTPAKIGALVSYAIMLAVILLMPGTRVSEILIWVFIGLAVIHAIEFVMVYPLLSRAPGSIGYHFFHTVLFGFFHWQPLKAANADEV